MHQINSEIWLPISIDEAWDFFSSPYNLSKITPDDMEFKILSSNLNSIIYSNMIIDYQIKPMLKIPMHWKTKITKVIPKVQFTDVQLKGPYKTWEHTHTFIEHNNGLIIRDQVNYELPFGFLGKIIHALIIRKRIEYIFNFRKLSIQKIFLK